MAILWYHPVTVIDEPCPKPCDGFERCYCTRVTRAQVLTAIATQGCRTVEDLQRVTGACTGCRTCRPELEQLLAEQAILRKAPPA